MCDVRSSVQSHVLGQGVIPRSKMFCTTRKFLLLFHKFLLNKNLPNTTMSDKLMESCKEVRTSRQLLVDSETFVEPTSKYNFASNHIFRRHTVKSFRTLLDWFKKKCRLRFAGSTFLSKLEESLQLYKTHLNLFLTSKRSRKWKGPGCYTTQGFWCSVFSNRRCISGSDEVLCKALDKLRMLMRTIVLSL